ncbi:MAG: SusC/RagA family TonB-linked outer membrane protein, partial [Dysgonamonadaceae bacterium]|nr:SusC/RagA family TonB-linked outer membrane protein [Dysgonamonadaceae bacterium]
MKNIIIYILLSVSMSVLAQEQYKGKILDKDGKLLQGVLFYGDTSIIAVRHTPYSVSTILEDELQRSPELDINKSLYGKIAGLNVYQGAGTSSVNLATLQVHGSAPLVLIDGYPRDPSSITMSEIASFSLFTDAASAAMYGVRGGNGIINITTKKPGISPLQISVNYQYGISTKFRVPKFADSYTYAKNMNEAYRLDGLGRRYSDLELEAFQGGEFPFSFPDVDWQKEVYNDLGFNHQFNVLAKGGNERFRYVAGIIYSYDKAMFSHNDDDYRYTTKPFDSRLNLRTNIEVDLSKLTLLRVNLMGRLNEVNGANNINTFYNAVYTTPSAAFNVKNQSGIFGGNNIYGENNPVAMLGSSGHRKETLSTLFSDMSIKQDLPSITKGLYAQLSIAFDNRGVSWETSSKTYRYEDLRPTVHDDKQVTVNPIVYGTDSEVLSHGSGLTSVYINTDFQAQLGYNRSFGEHQLSGAAILDMQSSMVNGQNRSMKRQSWIASVYYAYKNKYVLNGVLNNSGSAVLPKNDRYILYPAVSASWIVSNEDFMNTKLVNSLRLKASFGLSGWDANTLHDLDIQNYEWSKGYYFGDNVGESSGYHEGRLPVENLTIEKSRKSTIGIDAGMFNDKLNLSAEVFYDRRTNILVNSSNSTSGIIGIEVGQLNAGIIDYKGIDLSLSYRDRISEFVYSISGIFSFTRDKQININEAYQEYDYLYHTGYSKNQVYGLEAIGLFNSQVEINNSPVQSF